MRDIIIVKINNPHKYKPFAKNYGILTDIMHETGVVNWSSNTSGISTNIKHGDYSILPTHLWEVIDGEVFVLSGSTYIATGLKVWFD